MSWCRHPTSSCHRARRSWWSPRARSRRARATRWRRQRATTTCKKRFMRRSPRIRPTSFGPRSYEVGRRTQLFLTVDGRRGGGCPDGRARIGERRRGDRYRGGGFFVFTSRRSLCCSWVSALTVGLSLSARAVHNNNEDRLLHERVQEAGVLDQRRAPGRRDAVGRRGRDRGGDECRPGLVHAGDGPARRPEGSVRVGVDLVDRPDRRQAGPRARRTPRARVDSRPSEIRSLLANGRAVAAAHGARSCSTRRNRASGTRSPRNARPARYIVFTESNLPKRPQVARDPGQRRVRRSRLRRVSRLGESSREPVDIERGDLPLTGRRSAITVPFGDNKLRIVMTPVGELGGTLLARLQWLRARLRSRPDVRRGGADRASGAPARAGGRARRRARRDRRRERAPVRRAAHRRADVAAQPVARDAARDPRSSRSGARYIAGVADIDIGGDWYDVMPLDNGNVMFVVGDVSGRGPPGRRRSWRRCGTRSGRTPRRATTRRRSSPSSATSSASATTATSRRCCAA